MIISKQLTRIASFVKSTKGSTDREANVAAQLIGAEILKNTMISDYMADKALEAARKLIFKLDWPQQSITYNNTHYYATGKKGTRRIDGVAVAEYENDNGQRLWLGSDGNVEED